MKELTPFRDLSAEEYKKWYKRNHYHKNKGLPIYYFEDSDLITSIKNMINKMRDRLISIVVKIR